MWFREAAGQTRGSRAGALGLLAAAAFVLGACGEDDFPNEPRPPSPIELTAAIDDRSVSVSPSRLFCPNPEDEANCLGAGLVTLTVSNQTDEPTDLTLEGPTVAETNEIPPGGTGTLKTNLEEGEYEASAGSAVDIRPARVTVGPDRPSSQNELLQP